MANGVSSNGSWRRLSEIIGPKALDDKFQRRIGMMRGATSVLEYYQQDSLMLSSLKAYTNGVNTYINSLTIDQYPREYKL